MGSAGLLTFLGMCIYNRLIFTTRRYGVIMFSVASVSVCVCLLTYRKFISGVRVYLENLHVKFVYQDHRVKVKVKVTGYDATCLQQRAAFFGMCRFQIFDPQSDERACVCILFTGCVSSDERQSCIISPIRTSVNSFRIPKFVTLKVNLGQINTIGLLL